MKSLSEFTSIEEARTHIEKHERMINADVVRLLMLNTGLYDWFMSQTEGLAKVAADNVRSGGEFNFMPSHDFYLGPTMDIVIATHFDKSEQLTALKAACLSYAVKEIKPYEHASEYEWALAKKLDIPIKEITDIDFGFAYITTSQACEKHNPQILVKTPKGRLIRKASFIGVSDVGEYKAAVPSGVKLFVHDYYGVM